MKLSKKQGFILFVLLVAITMSAVMSFGIISMRIGFPDNFLSIWWNDFLVGSVLAIPTSFIIVPLIKRWTDSLSDQGSQVSK